MGRPVSLVYLVCLVGLVEIDEPDQPDKPEIPNQLSSHFGGGIQHMVVDIHHASAYQFL
jgi:hypothetical protein